MVDSPSIQRESNLTPDINESNANDVSVESSRPEGFLEIQKDTMQVPFQFASMLDRLMQGLETAFDAAIYQCYNAFSNWDWGISHAIPSGVVQLIYRVKTELCFGRDNFCFCEHY